MKKLPNIMTFLLILAAVHVVHARWSHYHGTLLEVTRVRLCEELKEDMREHFMEDPGMRNVSIRVDLEFLNVDTLDEAKAVCGLQSSPTPYFWTDPSWLEKWGL